ncbi:MAG: hypothetical protein ACRD2W_17685 [Acidimicrobiales bacterium]
MAVAEAAKDISERVGAWKVERRSRVWDVADGATWWTSVDVIAGHATSAIVSPIRASLESMRIGVSLWSLANEKNARRVFGGENSGAPYVIVAMHGDSGRMILSPGDPTPGRTSSFSMDEVREMLRVPGKVVIAVGCVSGTQEWADVFFDGGATDYIAPAAAPFAHAAPLFVSLLFYGLTQHQSLADAVELARGVDDELAVWTHFTR